MLVEAHAFLGRDGILTCSKIVSSTHLLAAIFRAANDKVNDRLKSKNVHSEMVFCLSMNNNVRKPDPTRQFLSYVSRGLDSHLATLS